MNYALTRNRFLDNAVATAGPQQILTMLYDRLVLDLNRAELAQIAGKPSDEVVRCEECGRILVRTGESGL